MKKVQMVPIDRIRIINSRVRSDVKFQEMITNISKVASRSRSRSVDAPRMMGTTSSAGRDGSRPTLPSGSRRYRPSSWMRPCMTVT